MKMPYVGPHQRPEYVEPSKVWLLDAADELGRHEFPDTWNGMEFEAVTEAAACDVRDRLSSKETKFRVAKAEFEHSMRKRMARKSVALATGAASRADVAVEEQAAQPFSDMAALAEKSPVAALICAQAALETLDGMLGGPGSGPALKIIETVIDHVPDGDDDAITRRDRVWQLLRDALCEDRLVADALDDEGRYVRVANQFWRRAGMATGALRDGAIYAPSMAPLLLDRDTFDSEMRGVSEARPSMPQEEECPSAPAGKAANPANTTIAAGDGSRGKRAAAAEPPATTEQSGLTNDARRRGGLAPKYSKGLQDFVTCIGRKLQGCNERLTLMPLRAWLDDNLHDQNGLETGIEDCEDVTFDGVKLFWKDQKGLPGKIEADSLRPYLGRAKETLAAEAKDKIPQSQNR